MQQPPFNPDPSQQWRPPPVPQPPPQWGYPQNPQQPMPPQQSYYRQQPMPSPPLPPVPPRESKKPWYRRPLGVISILVGALLVCGLCGILTNSTHSSPSTGSGAANIVATQPTSAPTTAPVSNPTDTPTPAPTATPTSQPTATPTATPTPRPTVNAVKPTPALPAPTPTPRPAQLSLTFTQAINELVSVHTLPGAALTIKVLYACSGHYATSQSLRGTFSADSSGNYTWTWTNQSSCHGGVTATVTSSSGGQTVTNSASFTD